MTRPLAAAILVLLGCGTAIAQVREPRREPVQARIVAGSQTPRDGDFRATFVVRGPEDGVVIVSDRFTDRILLLDAKTGQLADFLGPAWSIDGKRRVNDEGQKTYGVAGPMAWDVEGRALFLAGSPVVRVDWGTKACVAVCDWQVTASDVAPDSKRGVLYLAGLVGPGSALVDFPGEGLFVVDLETREYTRIALGTLKERSNAWNDEGYTGTTGLKLDPTSGALYLVLNSGQGSAIRRVEPGSRKASVLHDGRSSLTGLCLAADGKRLYASRGRAIVQIGLQSGAPHRRILVSFPAAGLAPRLGPLTIDDEQAVVWAVDSFSGAILEIPIPEPAPPAERPVVDVRAVLSSREPGQACTLEVSFVTPFDGPLQKEGGTITVDLRESGLRLPEGWGPGEVKIDAEGAGTWQDVEAAWVRPGEVLLRVMTGIAEDRRVVLRLASADLGCPAEAAGGHRIRVSTSASPLPGGCEPYAFPEWRLGLPSIEGAQDALVYDVLPQQTPSVQPPKVVEVRDRQGDSHTYSKGRFGVEFAEDVTVAQANRLLAESNLVLVGVQGSRVLLQLPDGPIEQDQPVFKKLSGDRRVRHVDVGSGGWPVDPEDR